MKVGSFKDVVILIDTADKTLNLTPNWLFVDLKLFILSPSILPYLFLLSDKYNCIDNVYPVYITLLRDSAVQIIHHHVGYRQPKHAAVLNKPNIQNPYSFVRRVIKIHISLINTKRDDVN
jgi:hypothetical protein